MKKIIIFIFVILFSVFGINAGIKAVNSLKNDVKQVLPANSSNESPSNESSLENRVVVGVPQAFKIPEIDVNTSVEAGGLDQARNPILPKDPDNVIWYNLGPKPGEVGTAVMAGHWDKETGAPAVFYDLSKLQVGDKIISIDENNNEYAFKVVKKVDYKFDKVPLQEIYAGKTDTPMLNLITCGGTWNSATKLYSHRTVVYSELDE